MYINEQAPFLLPFVSTIKNVHKSSTYISISLWFTDCATYHLPESHGLPYYKSDCSIVNHKLKLCDIVLF